MVEPKNGSTILKPQNVKAVTTKFDIAKPQKRDSDNHINGKALTINLDRCQFKTISIHQTKVYFLNQIRIYSLHYLVYLSMHLLES